MGFKSNLEALKGLYVQAEARQAALEHNIQLILKGIHHIMASLDQVLADVQAESTVEDSVLTLLQGIKAQLDAAGLSPTQQATVDAIFAQVEADKTKLSAALVANTPAPSAVVATPAAT